MPLEYMDISNDIHFAKTNICSLSACNNDTYEIIKK